jgi:hypothetical protein
MFSLEKPNGWRYAPSGVLVGGMGQRHFDGTNLEPRKRLENAPTPTTTPALHQTQCGASVAPLLSEGRDRVHAVLGVVFENNFILARLLSDFSCIWINQNIEKQCTVIASSIIYSPMPCVCPIQGKQQRYVTCIIY